MPLNRWNMVASTRTISREWVSVRIYYSALQSRQTIGQMMNDLLNSMMSFWKDEYNKLYARRMPEIALIRGHLARWVEVLQQKNMLAARAVPHCYLSEAGMSAFVPLQATLPGCERDRQFFDACYSCYQCFYNHSTAPNETPPFLNMYICKHSLIISHARIPHSRLQWLRCQILSIL